MKKLFIIAALFSVNLLFASHGASSHNCDLKYNHCMGDCSVKYGSDSKCVQQCTNNYSKCKAGLETEDFVPQKASESKETTKPAEKEEHGHH